jgi:hypothetical protein
MVGEWEYKEYVRDYAHFVEGERPWAMLGTQVTRPIVRYEWWVKMKSSLLEDIQEWIEQGWEAVGDIGPDCLEIEETQKTDFMIRGPAIFNRNTYVYFKGVRVPMRRRKAQAVVAKSQSSAFRSNSAPPTSQFSTQPTPLKYERVYCGNCGQKIPFLAHYCRYCGAAQELDNIELISHDVTSSSNITLSTEPVVMTETEGEDSSEDVEEFDKLGDEVEEMMEEDEADEDVDDDMMEEDIGDEETVSRDGYLPPLAPW